MNIARPGCDKIDLGQLLADYESTVRELQGIGQQLLRGIDVVLGNLQVEFPKQRVSVLMTVCMAAQHVALLNGALGGHFESLCKALRDLDIARAGGADIGAAALLRGGTPPAQPSQEMS